MKILITGGAGFIASHIADKYLELGHEVVIIDNLSSGKKEYINKAARFYKADICDGGAVSKIISFEKPHVINHHAAQMSVRISVEDPVIDAQNNVIGLLNIFEAGKKNKVKKFIFASSGGVVYGDASQLPTPEDYEPKLPLSPYGVTKFAGENYLYYYQTIFKIPFIAFRYGNVYGPRQNPHGEAGVVAIFSRKLLKNEHPIINGDGLQTRDYVYVEDVVEANVKALLPDVRGVYNIGTSIEKNVNDLCQILIDKSKSTIKPMHGPPKAGEQRRSCLDISKAGSELQWKPKYSFESGLKKTFDFFMKNTET